jgi:hypothetical protein
MDPIMMDDEQTRDIIRNGGVKRIGRPCQYKMNNKKREATERESLDSDEKEVEDIHATMYIEDILCPTYERKTIGLRSDAKQGSPFQIQISVEPTTPCVTKTTKEEK